MDTRGLQPRAKQVRPVDGQSAVLPPSRGKIWTELARYDTMIVLDEEGIVLAASEPVPAVALPRLGGSLEGSPISDLLSLAPGLMADAIAQARREGACSLLASGQGQNNNRIERRVIARLFDLKNSGQSRLILTKLQNWPESGWSFSHEPYRALTDLRSTMIWRTLPDGTLVDVRSWGDYDNTSENTARGDEWVALIHPQDREMVATHWQRALLSGLFGPMQVRVLHSTGYFRWVRVRAVTVHDPAGHIMEWIGSIEDVDEDQEIDAARESETRLRLVLQASGLAFWQLELATGSIMWTREAREVAGVGYDVLIEPELFQRMLHPQDRAIVANSIRGLIDAGGSTPYEIVYRLRRLDNGDERYIQETARLLFDRSGSAQRIIGAVKDVTERMLAEQKLVHASSRDALTGLLNRTAMQARLMRMVRPAKEAANDAASQLDMQLSLLLLDIDAFKTVNDSFGHDVGDTLLRLTAVCLQGVAAGEGYVARVSGNGFALVLKTGGVAAARQVAERALARLAHPFTYRGVTMIIRACVGIAVMLPEEADPQDLLKNAELALQAAKSVGRNQIKVFAPEMRQAVERRLSLAREVGAALDAGLIIPFYQPKIDLQDGGVVGFEALARWHRQDGEMHNAVLFASAFLDPYLAVAIDAAMLQAVIRDLADWQQRRLSFGRVALNVSSFTLKAPGILESYLEQIEAAGVGTDRLQIEVTESVLLDRDAADVASLLRRFRSHGIHIALDDFGTGYASLIHLKHFPVDELKLDQSFVRNLERDEGDAAILSAVINLGRSLGIVTVAEGIETQGQAGRLRDWGCNLGQGFLYGPAVPSEEVPSLLG